MVELIAKRLVDRDAIICVWLLNAFDAEAAAVNGHFHLLDCRFDANLRFLRVFNFKWIVEFELPDVRRRARRVGKIRALALDQPQRTERRESKNLRLLGHQRAFRRRRAGQDRNVDAGTGGQSILGFAGRVDGPKSKPAILLGILH